MDTAIVSGLAAVGGSLVGSLGPVMANYIVQKGQTKREVLTHEIAQRESLYGDFIRDSARLYMNSMSSNLQTLDELVGLYALVSRMRLTASENVLHAAEKLVATIANQYREPNLTLAQIELEAQSGKVDPLRAFSSACRAELREITMHNSQLLTWRKRR